MKKTVVKLALFVDANTLKCPNYVMIYRPDLHYLQTRKKTSEKITKRQNSRFKMYHSK